jgi:predicted nucleic acid-binding protein
MRVYLDDSVISRALYTGREARFVKERDAAIVLERLIRLGVLEFVASDWLIAELSFGNRSAAEERVDWLPPYSTCVPLTDEIWDHGLELAGRNFSTEDALHIASAERGGADLLLTFDGRLVRGAAKTVNLHCRVVHALEWVQERFHG